MKPHAPAPIAKTDLPLGPLDWRTLVEWLRADGVISAEEAKRTIARCASAHSAQHPLQRLAVVGMARQTDGVVLDAEALTQWLAQRAGLAYLRIDPLKVDVGKVADVMSAAYAERHKVLPVQVSPAEVVVATAEPFITRLGARGRAPDAQERAPGGGQPAGDCALHRPSFLRWPSRCARPTRAVARPALAASSNWWNWARPTSSSMPTTRAWCRWWTGCGNTRLTSAPATSTWSRGASRA